MAPVRTAVTWSQPGRAATMPGVCGLYGKYESAKTISSGSRATTLSALTWPKSPGRSGKDVAAACEIDELTVEAVRSCGERLRWIRSIHFVEDSRAWRAGNGLDDRIAPGPHVGGELVAA